MMKTNLNFLFTSVVYVWKTIMESASCDVISDPSFIYSNMFNDLSLLNSVKYLNDKGYSIQISKIAS